MRREERSSFALIVVAIGMLCASGCASRATRGEGPEVLPVVAVTTFENKSGFAGQWQLGYASAAAEVLFLIILAVTITQYWATGRATAQEPH